MDANFAVKIDGKHERIADRIAIYDAAYLYAEAVDILGNSPTVDGQPDHVLVQATDTLAQCLTMDARLRLFLAGPDGPSTSLGDGGPAGVAAAVRKYFTPTAM